MPSRLSLLCERIIEAGWLGGLVLTPLLFNVHSDNSFELDKAMALRTLALLILVAWTVREIEGGGGGWRSAWRSDGVRWWMILGLTFLAVNAIATVFSVAPRLSLGGSLARAQGLYTTGALLVVYLSLLVFLRRPEQLERLISTVLVASFPVSLYGIIQHFGTDPVTWSEDVTVRVASTLGNPIFVGAFLAMSVPLTLYRHLVWGRRVTESEGGGVRRVLTIGGLLSLALQVAGWWLGPTTGSLVAATTLGIWIAAGRLLASSLLPFLGVATYSVLLSAQLACLLLSQSRGPWMGLAAGIAFLALFHGVARRAWRVVALTTGLGLGAILILVGMNVPGSPLSSARELPYLERLTGALASTGRVRLLIWEAVDERLESDPARALIGYGPETVRLVTAPFVSPELAQLERRGSLPDRAHNELLDAVATTGLAGAAVYLLLFTCLVLWTVPSLGVARSLRERLALLGLWVGGGVAGALLSPSDGFWGPAIPLGMLGGLALYLIGCTIPMGRSPASHPAGRWTTHELLMASLLSALVVHFVETQVGIAVTATRTYFWVYAAMLVSTRRIHESNSEPRPLAYPLVVALVLGTLSYGFVSLRTGIAELPSLAWLFGLTWFFGGLVGIASSRTARDAVRSAATCSVLALAIAGGFAAAHLGWLRWLGDTGRSNAPVTFYLFAFVILVVLGASLFRSSGRPERLVTLSGALSLPVLLAAGGVVAVRTNLDAVRANIAYKQARYASLPLGGEDRAIGFVQQALELEPGREEYRGLLGDLLARKAQLTAEVSARDGLFEEAEMVLRGAADESPLDLDLPVKLARVYATWALGTDDPRREERFQESRAYYERALERWPANVLLWNELAALHLAMGDRARAVEVYRRSLALDGRFVETHIQLADLFRLGGEWERAAETYERAIETDPRRVQAHQALADVYTRMGRLDDAIRSLENSIAHLEADPQSHHQLARLYFSTGRFDQAQAHAQRALELVPPGQRPAIEQFLAQVERALAATR